MRGRTATLEIADPGRLRLLGLLALLLVAAQLLFAAHAAAKSDFLLDHSPATCAVCIAGTASGDPELLVVSLAKPVAALCAAEAILAVERVLAFTVAAAPARAPPLR